MRFFYRVTLVLASILFLENCKTPGAEGAALYNDLIVHEILAANTALGAFYREPRPEVSQLDSIREMIDASIVKLQDIKDIEKESNIRKEGINLLTFYKDLIENDNRKLLQLANDHPYLRSDSIQIVQLLTQIVKLENRHNDKFQEEQEVFADDFNIILVRE